MFFTLDRIEGGWAVFDSPFGGLKLPIESAGSFAQEGNVFLLEHGLLVFCPEETKKARVRAEALVNSLFAD